MLRMMRKTQRSDLEKKGMFFGVPNVEKINHFCNPTMDRAIGLKFSVLVKLRYYCFIAMNLIDIGSVLNIYIFLMPIDISTPICANFKKSNWNNQGWLVLHLPRIDKLVHDLWIYFS